MPAVKKKNMTEDLKERGRKHITPALVFHTDIEVRKAYGIHVEGSDGKTYMDFSSGLATVNIGHCPPEVLEAAKRQMDSLVHSGCIFRYSSEGELAEGLSPARAMRLPRALPLLLPLPHGPRAHHMRDRLP